MNHQLVLLMILHQGFTQSFLHFNKNNNNDNKKVESKIFRWIDELCDIFRNNDVESKDLSLETYFTNQSRKSVDFFDSLSRHISRSNEHYTVSLRSHFARDFLQYSTHDYLDNIRKIKSDIQYRIVVVDSDTINVIFHSMFGWNNEQHTFIIFCCNDDYRNGREDDRVNRSDDDHRNRRDDDQRNRHDDDHRNRSDDDHLNRNDDDHRNRRDDDQRNRHDDDHRNRSDDDHLNRNDDDHRNRHDDDQRNWQNDDHRNLQNDDHRNRHDDDQRNWQNDDHRNTHDDDQRNWQNDNHRNWQNDDHRNGHDDDHRNEYDDDHLNRNDDDHRNRHDDDQRNRQNDDHRNLQNDDHRNTHDDDQRNWQNDDHRNGHDDDHRNEYDDDHLNRNDDDHRNRHDDDQRNWQNDDHRNWQNDDHRNRHDDDQRNWQHDDHRNWQNDDHRNRHDDDHQNRRNGDHQNWENDDHRNRYDDHHRNDQNDDEITLKSMTIDLMESVLKKIWKKFGVYNVFFPSFNRTKNNSHAWMYNPFFKDVNRQNHGKLMEIELSNECIRSLNVFRNFNGYEINVGLFHSPPSAPRFNPDESDIEDPVVEDFYGVDGYVVGTFVKYYNLRVKIRGPSDGIEYGFVEANGTYTGTLGDVANGRISASFNSQYIKKYSPIGKPADVLEFSTPIDNDRVCIIVPSPDEIPRWLRLYHSFRPEIWACFAVSMIVSSLFWRIMQYTYTKKPPGYHDVLLETFLIYIGAPVDIRGIRKERVLVAAMLFLGMTIMAVLTGTIYDSFTVEMFYPAINTLEELDQNGLNIGTSALSLIDIFGSDDNDTANERPVFARLQHKIKYTPYNPLLPSIKKTAIFRNVASIARSSSFAVSRHEYVDDKGRSLLHLVGDCPQTYHLGYLLPKHSYLRRPLDHMILKLQQGGFVKLWKIRAIRTLIFKQTRRLQSDDKLKDPLPFTVTDMQTCFLILGFGLGIAICVFVGEVVFKPGWRARFLGKTGFMKRFGGGWMFGKKGGAGGIMRIGAGCRD